MISLVEFCKTVPGDIFGLSDSQLKWLRNLLMSDHFFSNTTTDMIKDLNFDVQMVLKMRKMENS